MEVFLFGLFLLLVAGLVYFFGYAEGKESTKDAMIRVATERDEAIAERDRIEDNSDEHYQWYSDECDEHEKTTDDLEAAQELLAEADRANKQLYSAVEIKNQYIRKLERTLEGRDNVLRAFHARIEHLAE